MMEDVVTTGLSSREAITAIRAAGGEVVAAAAKWLDPKAASIVVVGDAKAFLPALRKAYPALEVIPAAAVKLDTAALK